MIRQFIPFPLALVTQEVNSSNMFHIQFMETIGVSKAYISHESNHTKMLFKNIIHILYTTYLVDLINEIKLRWKYMYKIQGDHFSDRYSFSFRTECGYESLTPHICYTMKKLFPIYHIYMAWHGNIMGKNCNIVD